MHNLRHFYYQNKEKIWKVVLIITFLLGLIYFLNKQLTEKSQNTTNTANTMDDSIYSDEKNNTYISEKSAISGQKVTESEVKQINSTISKFLQYCKNKEVENAYNMLSADCKEKVYNTLEEFQEKYINSKFGQESIFEIDKWINNTYKISISKDLLATGDVSNNEKRIEYITIVTENSQEKLNINSYIGKQEINKQMIQDNVKVTALNKNVYIDYEEYNFEIENLSSKTVVIDSLQKIGTMYLKDSNGNKYNAYAHEIFEQDLEIKTKQKTNISIKYAKTYTSKSNIESITFKNIILDYIEYKNTEDKEQFEKICEITIEI